MTPLEFKNEISLFLGNNGFITKNNKFIKENEELYCVIEIQKSIYDANNCYINYWFSLKIQSEKESCDYKSKDLFGRFIQERDFKKTDLINILDVSKTDLIKLLDSNIKIVNNVLNIGIKKHVEDNPSLNVLATLRLKEYLNNL